ncbi:hypothetical protein P691DRAFT_790616 [Macrolepiota fuliginosa MF-IS2]|uniref:Uncharacterized protein n=1 Tax=Macrolepiota fuliginosa MF-IS2 TaxID=1400762 RepID=A0A9P5WZ50_9AGAR|nr:hypothetical protein P691DRAFT_790616 [Macrolepiota fuliginosa MF-IS2]
MYSKQIQVSIPVTEQLDVFDKILFHKLDGLHKRISYELVWWFRDSSVKWNLEGIWGQVPASQFRPDARILGSAEVLVGKLRTSLGEERGNIAVKAVVLGGWRWADGELPMQPPDGSAPPFRSAPPVPVGVTVPLSHWNSGKWVFNPNYNLQDGRTSNDTSWVPDQAWDSHSQPSFNPYKRQTRPPSPDYLATDNFLDLPVAELGGGSQEQGQQAQAITPWIWAPRRPEHAFESYPNATADSTQWTPDRPGSPQIPGSFTSKAALQPTFSANVVRTPYAPGQIYTPSTGVTSRRPNLTLATTSLDVTPETSPVTSRLATSSQPNTPASAPNSRRNSFRGSSGDYPHNRSRSTSRPGTPHGPRPHSGSTSRPSSPHGFRSRSNSTVLYSVEASPVSPIDPQSQGHSPHNPHVSYPSQPKKPLPLPPVEVIFPALAKLTPTYGSNTTFIKYAPMSTSHGSSTITTLTFLNSTSQNPDYSPTPPPLPPPQISRFPAPALTPPLYVDSPIPVVDVSARRYRRKGFWNRRGDHVTPEGYIIYAPHDMVYPPDLEEYPDRMEDGYMDEYGYRTQWVRRPAIEPEGSYESIIKWVYVS